MNKRDIAKLAKQTIELMDLDIAELIKSKARNGVTIQSILGQSKSAFDRHKEQAADRKKANTDVIRSYRLKSI